MRGPAGLGEIMEANIQILLTAPALALYLQARIRSREIDAVEHETEAIERGSSGRFSRTSPE
ncbi:MAG: hypothetical protein M3P40_09625, partial [Actinomycetota bacterium]|nr:hypothetical protein [Actinomycetota bacterium]